MTRRLSCLFTLAASVLLTAAVAAAQPPGPKPAPEMSQIAFFEGTWACEGKMPATPMGPAGTMTSTAEVRRELDGFWQAGVIKGSGPGLPSFEGRFYVTYDPSAKQYVMLWVDSMGAWSRSTATAWKGDTIVYEGDMHIAGQSFKARDTFTRAGAGAMKHVGEAQFGDKWMTTFEESCKKK